MSPLPSTESLRLRGRACAVVAVLCAAIVALGTGQIIALRFASDDELEELMGAVMEGKVTKGIEIKRAIKHWRADTFRV